MPSCTVDGAFGIARTTGTPSAIRVSMCLVVIAAATERTVCLGSSSGPISSSSVSMSWGFTATTTMAAPRTASGFEVVASTLCSSRSSAMRSSRRDVTTMSVQPELLSPASSASPMRPPPMIAMRSMRRGYAATSPREKPASRYMLAIPAHLPYGSRSSAVSHPSTGRPRRARRSLTRPRSPTSP